MLRSRAPIAPPPMLQRTWQQPLVSSTRSRRSAPVRPTPALLPPHMRWKFALVAGLFGVGLVAADTIGRAFNRPEQPAIDLSQLPDAPPPELIDWSRQQAATSGAIVRGQADGGWEVEQPAQPVRQQPLRPVQPLAIEPRQQANPTSYYNSYRAGQAAQATRQNAYSNYSAPSAYPNGYANRVNPVNAARSSNPGLANSGNQYGARNNSVTANRYQPNSAYSNYNYYNNQYNQRGRGSWNQGSFPVENFQTYTSPFGYRRRGGGVEFHKGLDLAAPKGSYIRSWWTGRVTKVSEGGLCGTSITIQSGAWEHVYCHMIGRVEVIQGRRYLSDRDGGILIPQGQAIATGSRIGRVGMTGRTTGPHLHWGIKYGKDWIDPALVLRAMYQQQAKNQ